MILIDLKEISGIKELGLNRLNPIYDDNCCYTFAGENPHYKYIYAMKQLSTCD